MELAASPRLGHLYGAAALSAARLSRPASLPDVTFVLRDVAVSPDRLAAYDRVCGYRLTDVLPPTYPHVLAFPLGMALMTRPDFPLPPLGLVHVANSVTVSRPVRLGERLAFTVRAADLRPHDRGRQFDVLAEARVGDELVWTGRSVYLHRSRGPSAPTPAGSAAAGPPTPAAVWQIGRRVGPDYADVSGDHNPIHTSRVAARLFGFPSSIAHGMWSKARCLAALEGRLPDAYTVDVAFKLPVVLPARVGFSAQRTDGWRFALHDARTGKPHLTGTLAVHDP